MTPSNLRTFTVTETRQAVEVTAENLDVVAAWCGGKVYDREDDPSIGYESGESREWAVVGDVLVTDGTRWWDVTREEFERDSEQWTEETA